MKNVPVMRTVAVKKRNGTKPENKNSIGPIDKDLCELIREKEEEIERQHETLREIKAEVDKHEKEFVAKYGIDSLTCINRLLSIYDKVRGGKLNAEETFEAILKIHTY